MTPQKTHQRAKTPARGWAALGVMLLVSQRLAIPIAGGQVPLNALIAILLIVALVSRGGYRLSPAPLILLMTFAAIGGISALVSPEGGSILSLAQVLLLWLPWVLGAASNSEQPLAALLSAVVHMTVAASLFAVVQTSVSAATGVFPDPLAAIPSDFLLSGYNTTYNVGSIGDWDKGNGGIFLEPSFLSLFAALAITILIVDSKTKSGRRGVFIACLAAGMACSAALSGLVVVPAVILAALRHPRRSLVVLSGLAVVIGFAASTPIVQAFLARLGSSGSNDARLVRPYTELLPLVLRERPLLGYGPGGADDAAALLSGNDWQAEVTAPTIVKLLFDYGLIGGVVLALLVVLVLARSRVPGLVKLALLIALVVPTNGLANPVLAPLTGFILVAGVAASAPRRLEYRRRYDAPYRA